tara:strand:+ start:214 stop:486 length:273 start_codon:yes stop_codon:yes gene_type:complete
MIDILKQQTEAPLGWQWVDGKLVKHESEQEVIKLITELRELGVTLAAIAQNLNDAGYITKRNGKWTATTARRTLKAIAIILNKEGVRKDA